MKKSRRTNYHIQQRNQHLKSILDESYYVELGVIDVKVLDKLLNYEVVKIEELAYKDILIEGIGQIGNGGAEEYDLQLAYLDSLRSKSTSHKIFLTMGVLRYEIQNQEERYAPIVLVPVDMDIVNKTIVMSSEAIQNTLLINDLQASMAIDITPLTKEAKAYEIHQFCEQVSKKTGFSYTITNFLTVVAVEYSDTNLNFDDMSVQRSIYEQTSFDVYQNFFSRVKTIKPTNIYQKWVLLKIDNGESFFVDGRLGTGKTYTIINGIADAISPNKKKKVMYVSQDRNNLNKVYSELNDLHLSPYVYNLCRNISFDNNTKDVYENIREEKIGIETLYPISDYEQALNASIHRCRYSNIITELASIKNMNPDITPIPIDANLEYNEIQNVYSELKEIENILDVIDPLDVNVWRNIEQYYSHKHADEIIKATQNYLNIVIKFNKAIKAYCKAYDINLPTSFINSQKLLSYIATFKKMMPPASWVNKYNKNKIDELLKSIEVYQKQFEEIKAIVSSKVIDEYEVNTIQKLFEVLCFKHLSAQNEEYINNLLSSTDLINKTKDQIIKSKKEMNEAIVKLKQLFVITNMDDTELEFIRKTNGLLSQNKIHNTWVEFYNQRVNVKQHYLEIESVLEKYLSIKKYLSTFLIKEDTLNYASLKQVTLQKDYVKLILALFDRKALKKNKVPTDSIMPSIFDMIDAGDKVKELADKYNIFYGRDLEEFIFSYDNWINFLNSLSIDETNILRNQLLKNKKAFTEGKEIVDNYNIYQTNERILNKQYQELSRYGISITGNNIIIKNINSTEWVEYLKRVVDTNIQLVTLYKGKDVTFSDLMTIIECDNEYNNLQNILKLRDKEMKEYLGTTYDGLNTNVQLISVLEKHYAKFVDNLKDKSTISMLFSENKMTSLVNEFDRLNELLENNILCHNIFSKYFTGGWSSLLECSLDEAYKKLIKFDDHISEVKLVFTIFDYCHHFEKLGLISLSEGILSSEYARGISTRYLYSVYSDYKTELINENTILAESGNILTWLQNYKYFEKNMCNNNLKELERNKPNIDRKFINHANSILFNDYDRIINDTISQKSVYLADVNIFNSQIDLSKFDIIFVDDVHLASSFKYTHLDDVNQIVLFGDSSAKAVRSNNIFVHVPQKNIFNLVESYCVDNPQYGNIPSNKNQYILSYPKPEQIKMFSSTIDLSKEIIKSFLKDKTKKIDIIISSNNYKLDLTKNLLEELLKTSDSNEIINYFDKSIRIVRGPYEAASICDEVYFIFDDIYNLDEKYIKYMLTNYSLGAKSINIFYTEDIEIDDMKGYLKQIIGNGNELPQKEMNRLTQIIYNQLVERGFNVSTGPGRIDLMIKGKVYKNKENIPNVGIIIEGMDGKATYAILDDYDYYYNEYMANGWQMYIFCVNDIIDNLSEKLDMIASFLSKYDTQSTRQLKIDDFIK